MIDFSLLESDIEKVEFIQNLGQLIHDNQITPESLNNGLGNYFNASAFLTNIYEQTSLEHEMLKTDYNIWFSERFIEERNKLNDGKPQSKYASQSEINNSVIVEHKQKYKELQTELLLSEKRVSFYRRLCESFKVQSQILINLSQSMRSELYSLSVENRANKDIQKEAIINRSPIKKVKQIKGNE